MQMEYEVIVTTSNVQSPKSHKSCCKGLNIYLFAELKRIPSDRQMLPLPICGDSTKNLLLFSLSVTTSGRHSDWVSTFICCRHPVNLLRLHFYVRFFCSQNMFGLFCHLLSISVRVQTFPLLHRGGKSIFLVIDTSFAKHIIRLCSFFNPLETSSAPGMTRQ